MKTNFDYLFNEKSFDSFSNIAIAAEKLLRVDAETCIINCRRAMEMTIKWMYSVDEELVLPYQDDLYTLMRTQEFRDIVQNDLWIRLDYIRRQGNDVVHNPRRANNDIAELCLENLFYFMDFVSYCYGEQYEEKTYDKSLLELKDEVTQYPIVLEQDVDINSLIEENKALREQLTAQRVDNSHNYVAKPLDLSEFKTRKLYIDSLLIDAGWIEGKNWINEVELEGMPNQSEKGYADYVLYDDRFIPLAVIEAKKTCVDVSKGRQQAKLYADIIEKKYHRRPVIFLTNGFDTRIVDGQYPERRVAAIYSKQDLEKLFNLRQMKSSLGYVNVDKNIAGRYYQEAAIKAVCDSLDNKNKRKSLLVMATGSGKTRTVIGLVDVLLEHGWVKNVLFLADESVKLSV